MTYYVEPRANPSGPIHDEMHEHWTILKGGKGPVKVRHKHRHDHKGKSIKLHMHKHSAEQKASLHK